MEDAQGTFELLDLYYKTPLLRKNLLLSSNRTSIVCLIIRVVGLLRSMKLYSFVQVQHDVRELALKRLLTSQTVAEAQFRI
jgi:hypothetical protein